MRVYCYTCEKCGDTKEYSTLAPASHGQRWHNTGSGEADSGCGGVMRRNWKAENVSMKRVPGGGREHSS